MVADRKARKPGNAPSNDNRPERRAARQANSPSGGDPGKGAVPSRPQEGHRSHMERLRRPEARLRIWIGVAILLVALLFVLFSST